jgi:3-phosphoshikimate 1-carboxyvinyltransferase
LNFKKIDDFDNCQLCISLGDSHLPNLLKQIQETAQWADLIEIRLDKLLYFDSNSMHSSRLLEWDKFISLIEASSTCPIIWTLRKASQGGDFQGTEEERFHILSSLLCNRQPAFIDLEADTPERLIYALHKLAPQTQWIISWHHLFDTPENLDILYQKVSRLPAHYYKIVTVAHSTIDAIRMLNFTQKINQGRSHLCGICMGELGQPTRILGGLVRQPFTFASLEKGKETASGQLTAEELIMTYRFRDINKETQLLGLIGRPIDHSASHLTHNLVFKELSLNAIYLKFNLKDEELPCFFEEMKSLPLRGLSVTMPFKEKILNLLQYPHHLVACNTLVWTSEGWKGYNTDGIGALKALGLPALQNQKMVILGAGGTAKAIALAAHQQGVQLAILNRTLERAKDIAIPLQAQWGSLERLPSLIQEGYGCIIQATSVGMAPNFEESPVPVEWMTKETVVLDVISNPSETRFLREVKKKGGYTISGQELYIHQAVEQFTCWFGPQISQDQVERIIRQYLPKSDQMSRKEYLLLANVTACGVNFSAQSVRVQKSMLKGSLSLPPSKSHTIRAILLAAFANGTSLLHNLLNSPDALCAIQAASQFGAKVIVTSTGVAIQGVAGYPRTPSQVIDAGNSGQVLRFAGALAAFSEGYTVMTGDDSIRSNRPIQPLLDGLNGLKAWAVSTRENGYAPFIVKGPLQAGKICLDGKDSQPVSALLMAAAFLDGQTEIDVHQAGEKPWLALTLSWLDRLGVSYTQHHLEHFTIQGKRIRPAFEFTIPGDLSALAFPLAAALVTRSELLIQHIDLRDIQGDKALIYCLQQMEASLEIDLIRCHLKVLANGRLKGQIIDVNDFIDAVPILAVIGCFAEGETQLINASIARHKESNRLACITAELKKMGASIEETGDGLKIKQSQLKGACVNSHGDHRLAMSLIVAGLGAEGETEIQGIECIGKSYPTFLEDLIKIGATIDKDTSQKPRPHRVSSQWQNNARGTAGK